MQVNNVGKTKGTTVQGEKKTKTMKSSYNKV